MEGHELCEAVLCETYSGGPPYELEVYYDGNGDAFFRGGWDRFVEDHDIHQGWILMLTIIAGLLSSTSRSMMAPNARRITTFLFKL
jgi:hypothetical protein